MREHICGYVADSELHIGRSSAVYRAHHARDGRAAVLNAAAAVVQRLCGAGGLYPASPMTQNPGQYSYGP